MRTDGWTALHFAAYKGHETIIEILIDRGADAKKKNLDGKTPADICCYDAVEKAKGKRERLLLIMRGEENA